VAKGETLYGLARSYYGDHRRWKEIYEANRAMIGGNPNQIRVGQKLAIP
jgi:nucleoid-associated protein YgaU